MNKNDVFLRHLDWNLLYVFFVVVSEKGVSAAAHKLSLTQPAVSNCVRRLEEQIDKNLIDRTQHRFTLTTSGKLFFEECKEIYGTVSRLSMTLKDVTERVSGLVKLAMLTHVRCPILDSVIHDFHKLHPESQFEITINTSSEVIEHVNRKEATIGIGFMQEAEKNIYSEILYKEQFKLYCGSSHRLFNCPNIEHEDLENENFVSFPTDRPNGGLSVFSRLRSSYGMKGKIVAKSSYLEEVQRLIAAGIGIGPLPVHVVQQSVDQGKLRSIDLPSLMPIMDVHVMINTQTKMNRAESIFVDMLFKRIEQTLMIDRTYPLNTQSTS